MQDIFLYLISCAVNKKQIDWSLFGEFTEEHWLQLYSLSRKQGVVAVVFECIKNVPQEFAPSQELAVRWFFHAQSVEKIMKRKESIAKQLAEKFAERDIQTIVLKGIAYASYYPFSFQREYGDLDCFLMGKKEEGDRAVVEIGGTMEEAGPKHSLLYYKGLKIENHRCLTSFDNSMIGKETELLFQSLITIGYQPIGDSKLLNPCPDFNAMFLIKHAQIHFIKEGIYIKQLLDWAFFLKAEEKNVNWKRVIPMMEKCRILTFAKVMTGLCVEKLGLDCNVEALKDSGTLLDAVLEDILDEQPDPYHEKCYQKVHRICRRFYRMWKFRSLAYKSYVGLVCESFVVSSFLQKRFKFSL